MLFSNWFGGEPASWYRNLRLVVLSGLASILVAGTTWAQPYTYEDNFDEIWEKRGWPGTVGQYTFPEAMAEMHIRDILDFVVDSSQNALWELGEDGKRTYTLDSSLSRMKVKVVAENNKVIDFFPSGGFFILRPDNSYYGFEDDDYDEIRARITAMDWRADRSRRLYSVGRPQPPGLPMVGPTAGFDRVYHCDYECGDGRTAGWYRIDGTLDPFNSFVPPARADQSELRMHVLAVAAGNCVILECPGGEEALVVDCGYSGGVGDDPDGPPRSNLVFSRGGTSVTRSSYTFVKKAYDILKSKTDIDIVVTHSDIDHSAAIPDIFELDISGFQLREVVNAVFLGGNQSHYGFNRALASYAPNSASLYVAGDSWDTPGWYWRADRRKEPATLITTNTLPSCGGAQVRMLAVNAHGTASQWRRLDPEWRNAASIVLEVTYPMGANARKILLPGDGTRHSLTMARSNMGPNRAADILVAPHHGSSTHGSDDEDWIRDTKPTYLVYSHGDKFGHPTEATYDAYLSEANGSRLDEVVDEHTIWIDNDSRLGTWKTRKNKARVYSTYADGDVTFTVDAAGNIDATCFGPFYGPVLPQNVWCRK